MLQSVLRSTHDRSLNKYSEVDEEDDFQEVLDPPPIAAATQYQVVGLSGGAATCSKGFVVCFLKVPLSCWGSMAAAVQPNSLENSQKTFYKTSQNK